MSNRLPMVPLLALFVCEPLCASRLVEHDVDVAFTPDGSVLRTTQLRARGENVPLPWTTSPFVLRDDETLEQFSAEVVDALRTGPRLRRIRHFTEITTAEGTIHSALTKHWFELSRLQKGATVSLRYSVRSSPFFPEGVVEIPLDDPCRSARIAVRNPPSGFRYRVAQGLHVMVGDGPTEVTVTRPSPCQTSAANQRRKPLVLNFAWGAARSWGEVGSLYEQQLERSASEGTQTRSYARGLLRDVSDNAERKLDLLYEFVKAKIRYAAVELGDGWYVPASPSAVLTRGWGDCKEKALLLVELLEEGGIEANVALVDSTIASDDQVDPAFPRISAFNHAIVAVREESIQSGGEGGWIFLDPSLPATDERALHPVLEGRLALVLRPGGRSSLERVRASRGAMNPLVGAILNSP